MAKGIRWSLALCERERERDDFTSLCEGSLPFSNSKTRIDLDELVSSSYKTAWYGYTCWAAEPDVACIARGSPVGQICKAASLA